MENTNNNLTPYVLVGMKPQTAAECLPTAREWAANFSIQLSKSFKINISIQRALYRTILSNQISHINSAKSYLSCNRPICLTISGKLYLSSHTYHSIYWARPFITLYLSPQIRHIISVPHMCHTISVKLYLSPLFITHIYHPISVNPYLSTYICICSMLYMSPFIDHPLMVTPVMLYFTLSPDILHSLNNNSEWSNMHQTQNVWSSNKVGQMDTQNKTNKNSRPLPGLSVQTIKSE